MITLVLLHFFLVLNNFQINQVDLFKLVHTKLQAPLATVSVFPYTGSSLPV